MQLLGIRIENYRSLRQPVEIGPLSPGINVIHGPNETGKSTVMDGIARGLFDKHTVSGAEMQKRVPWGSKLGPAVTIEFEIAGKTYRVFKRFVHDTHCTLEEKTRTGWEKVAEKKTADQQITDILRASQPGSGLTKPEHWGLAQVLWVPQGQAAQPQEVSGAQQNQIQQTLQLTLDTTQGEAIEKAVQKLYDQVYTPGGVLRKGDKNKARSVSLTEEILALKSTVEELAQKQNQVQELVHKIDQAERAHAEVKRELRQSEAELRTLSAGMAELAQQQLAYKTLEAARDKAQEAWAKINRLVNQVRAADENAKEAAARVPDLEANEARLNKHNAALLESLGQLQEQIAKTRREQESAQTEIEAVDRGMRRLDLLAKLNLTRQQAQKADQAHADLLAAQSRLAGLVAPTQSQIKELRELQRKIGQQQAIVDAGSLKLTFTADAAFDVQPVIDGVQKAAINTAGDTNPVNLQALASAELLIHGVGKIHAQAGRTDAHAEKKKLDELSALWEQKTGRLGTDDLDVLQQRIIERGELEAKVKSLRERHAELDPNQSLRAELAAQANEIASLESRHPDLKSQTHGREQLEPLRLELINRRDRLKAEVASLEKRAGQQQEQARESTDRLNAVRLEISGAKAMASAALKVASDLRAEDNLTDQVRQTRLYEALTEKDQAQQRLAMTPRPAIEQARDREERIKRAHEAQVRREREMSDECLMLQDRLRNGGGQGLYDQWVQASEKLEEKQKELARVVLDEQAVKLLWDTLSAKKRSVLDAVMAPVKNLVTVGLRQLTGPAYQSVMFDAALRPTAVIPAGRDVQPGPDELSYGTREQLLLLVRLALARLLSREGERQCVVLDDPLVNTDRARQSAALAVLEEASRECQLIIFTCHPGAYEGLSNPAMFDLKKLAGK